MSGLPISTNRSVLRTSLATGALGLGLLGFAAAPAFAGTSTAAISVEPHVVKPGGSFEVAAQCHTRNIQTSATINEVAFGGPSAVKMGIQQIGFTVTVQVPATTKPGFYTLPVTCADGSTGNATITVSPSGTIHTGGGYMSQGVDSTVVIAGAGLVGIAAAGGAVMIRRRRQTT